MCILKHLNTSILLKLQPFVYLFFTCLGSNTPVDYNICVIALLQTGFSGQGPRKQIQTNYNQKVSPKFLECQVTRANRDNKSYPEWRGPTSFLGLGLFFIFCCLCGFCCWCWCYCNCCCWSWITIFAGCRNSKSKFCNRRQMSYTLTP